MKKICILLLAVFPFMLWAQEKDESKYLGNVVPVVDGKVTFTHEINAPGMSQSQLFNALLSWANARFTTNQTTMWGKILLSDEEKATIACKGEEYIVFTDKALVLDRARISYRMIIECFPEKCNLEISNITYLYPEGKEQERISAEDWITDENAMNKKRTRLYRATGKFRIKTVDLAEGLFEDAQKAIDMNSEQTVKPFTPPRPIAGNVQPIVDATLPDGDIPGYKRISADRIPGNIIKQLSESWSLITAGDNNQFNMMTASWGGLGFLYNKPVSFCFINPTRYTYQLMEKGDYYTISFYTETYREALNYCGSSSGRDAGKVSGSGLTPITTPSGSKAFSEAWMIIECRKLVSQPVSYEGMNDEELKQNWKGKETHKMYIGEILNVWVK